MARAVALVLLLAVGALAGCATPTSPTPASSGGALQVSSGLLPAWKEATYGQAPLPISGGAPPYACSADPTSPLPSGFALAACNVTGTPPLLSPGTTRMITPPFRVNVTDGAGATAQGTFQIPIVAQEQEGQEDGAQGGEPGGQGDAVDDGDGPGDDGGGPATPLELTVDAPTCTLDAEIGWWEIRFAGTARGAPLATVIAQVRPVGPAATPEVSTAQTDASWSELPEAEPDPQTETAPLVQRQPGEDETTRWAVSGVYAPVDAEDAVYSVFVVLNVPGSEPVQQTRVVTCEGIPDTTVQAVSVGYVSCNANAPAGTGWEMRGTGTIEGPVGSLLALFVVPQGSSRAVDVGSVTLDASWPTVDGAVVSDQGVAALPSVQRARGLPNLTWWTFERVMVVASENDQTYLVTAMLLEGENRTVRAEQNVTCYAPPPTRSVFLAAPTCTLVGTDHRQLGGSGPETRFTWLIGINGSGSGRAGDSFGVSLGQPRVHMDKSGGAFTAGWSGSPSSTVDRSTAQWRVTRLASDPSRMDWRVSGLTVSTWEYDVFVADLDPTFDALAQLYQESARASVTCPKG